MDRSGREGAVQTSDVRQVLGASFIGTTIEWYDFFIYGTAAALVFPGLFFPGFGETAGTILSYSTFAVGFVARPIQHVAGVVSR
jgi:MFS transporter, MHS family, shikimate and dehydroshikimate transport protein